MHQNYQNSAFDVINHHGYQPQLLCQSQVTGQNVTPHAVQNILAPSSYQPASFADHPDIYQGHQYHHGNNGSYNSGCSFDSYWKILLFLNFGFGDFKKKQLIYIL